MSKKASLDGIHTRLSWARKYVKDLEDACAAFMSTDPDPGSAIEYEQKPGRILVSVYLPNGFPIDFGRLMGGAFHQLRSLLDNLAYQLVLVNERTPSKQTEFPVIERLKEGTTFEAKTRRALTGMSDTARAQVKALQPFETWPEHPEHTTIWLVHELNNIDKHRLAHLACLWVATCGGQLYVKGNVATADIGARFEHIARRGVAEHGAPLLDVRWNPTSPAADPHRDVMMEVDISTDVALKNPERANFLDPDGISTEALPITHFLNTALDYCNSTLLPTFADEFK